MHPEIQVDGSTAPDAVDNEMLVAFIKAGTNSHVHQSVNMEDTWYFSRDLLLPLQDLPGFDEVMDKMNPKLNYVWKDGNVYSISWYSGPRVMFYNGQRVREAGLDPENPPETYSEFLEWAEALTDDSHWFINLWSQEEWWRWQFMGYPFYIGATGTQPVGERRRHAGSLQYAGGAAVLRVDRHALCRRLQFDGGDGGQSLPLRPGGGHLGRRRSVWAR